MRIAVENLNSYPVLQIAKAYPEVDLGDVYCYADYVARRMGILPRGTSPQVDAGFLRTLEAVPDGEYDDFGTLIEHAVAQRLVDLRETPR